MPTNTGCFWTLFGHTSNPSSPMLGCVLEPALNDHFQTRSVSSLSRSEAFGEFKDAIDPLLRCRILSKHARCGIGCTRDYSQRLGLLD